MRACPRAGATSLTAESSPQIGARHRRLDRRCDRASEELIRRAGEHLLSVRDRDEPPVAPDGDAVAARVVEAVVVASADVADEEASAAGRLDVILAGVEDPVHSVRVLHRTEFCRRRRLLGEGRCAAEGDARPEGERRRDDGHEFPIDFHDFSPFSTTQGRASPLKFFLSALGGRQKRGETALHYTRDRRQFPPY